MDKRMLRAMMAEKKQALTARQIELAGKRLAAQFFAHPLYAEAKSIYGYLPFNQEVPLEPILLRARQEGRRVAAPRITEGVMRFFWLDDPAAVRPGVWGIREPDGSCPPADDETALVILPGLAFDSRGFRVGYGGGYYDRYLAVHPKHPTIALCYAFQLVPQIPAQAFDRPAGCVLSASTEVCG